MQSTQCASFGFGASVSIPNLPRNTVCWVLLMMRLALAGGALALIMEFSLLVLFFVGDADSSVLNAVRERLESDVEEAGECAWIMAPEALVFFFVVLFVLNI
jgi:hypothetical protein